MVALTKKKTLPSEVFFLKIGPNLVDGIRRNHCDWQGLKVPDNINSYTYSQLLTVIEVTKNTDSVTYSQLLNLLTVTDNNDSYSYSQLMAILTVADNTENIDSY